MRDILHLNSPNQPRNYNYRKSGPKSHERSFQPTWYNDYSWLHYDEDKDAVFYLTCLKAAETNSLSVQSLIQGDAFTKKGFSNWKKACEKSRGFKKHQTSKAHQEALARYVKTATSHDVIDLISSEAAFQRSQNR